MGQQLSRLGIGGQSLQPDDLYGDYEHDSRPVIEQIHGIEDESPRESLPVSLASDKSELEAIADDFMNQRAFSTIAEKYGIPDDYISQDLPMEVRLDMCVSPTSTLRLCKNLFL